MSLTKRNFFKNIVFGLVTLALAWYSYHFFLGWSASLPPWEASLESSAKLGYTDQRYEFVFFCLTFYLPFAVLSAIITYIVSRQGNVWVVPICYALVLYSSRHLNFYSWGAITITVFTMSFSLTTAWLCHRRLTSKASG